MDPLQEQVIGLNQKVDALHQVIEQLSSKISEVLSDVLLPDKGNRSPWVSTSGRYSYQSRSSYDLEMEHKDILADVDFLDSDSHGSDSGLSSEVQIQRLTAQLTAAYNRIAALEEQLLAQRIH